MDSVGQGPDRKKQFLEFARSAEVFLEQRLVFAGAEETAERAVHQQAEVLVAPRQDDRVRLVGVEARPDEELVRVVCLLQLAEQQRPRISNVATALSARSAK